MRDDAPPIRRRLSAILAADIAGYSRLMGQDEAGTVRDLVLNLIGSGDVDGALSTAEIWRRVAPGHFEARVRDGYQMERPDDEHRTVTFLRIAAGLEDRSAADAWR